jgi:arsenate reductase-like glutaredoxin family protein
MTERVAPDFTGAREWVAKIDANDLDKKRLVEWMEKVKKAYDEIDNAHRDALQRIDDLEDEALEVEPFIDAINDHRLGLLDDRELHDLA